MSDAASKPAAASTDSGSLSVWDAGSLIIGIVIGASLFRVPSDVFSSVPGVAGGLWLWLIGGLLSLAGALCYSELAAAYPRLGGDYVYLSRAYGRWMGFLFGWMRFTVIIPANIGAMAFIFAEHARRLGQLDAAWQAPLALTAILVLTAVNLGGVRLGTRVQNGLTVLKLLGLAAIIVAGFGFAVQSPEIDATPATDVATPQYGLALVLILYAYGGWSDAAFVAAEVRDVRRNLPRALVLGLGTIIVLYLLVNAAYATGLGLDGVRSSSTPAAELLQRSWGRSGEVGVILIVMLSTLGAINGMIFSGARLTVALGEGHRVFSLLGRNRSDAGNPHRAVLSIAAVSVLLVWLVGTDSGVRLLGWLLTRGGMSRPSWEPGEQGFETLVIGAAPTFWIFFCLTAAAVPLLRFRDPHVERPFRCWSPLMPLVFGATSVYMLWSSVMYARTLAWFGAGLLLCGAVLLLIDRPTSNAGTTSSHAK